MILVVEPAAGLAADPNILAPDLAGLASELAPEHAGEGTALGETGEVRRIEVDLGRLDAAPERLAEIAALLAPPGDGEEPALTLFWRTEDVAARLLAFGLGPAVIVPSARQRPAAYWQMFTGSARFLTLSRRRHEALQAAECRSAVFDYWPEPPASIPHRAFAPADWSAVFVDTGGDTLPTAASVAQQCRILGIGDLTVLTPDEAAAPGGMKDGALFVFTAPEPGIDHTVRAAMGRGQIVVAPRIGAAAETIGHLSSGILVDPARPTDLPELTQELVERLAHGARHKATLGRQRWQADAPRRRSVLTDDGTRWSGGDLSAHLGNRMQKEVARRRAG